jgi:acyl-CoA synthetase (NDP forming)
MLGDDADVPAEIISGFRQLDIPLFRSPERALRALGRISHIGEPSASAPPPATPAQVERLRPGTMPEYLAKQLLADFGFPVPRGGLARDADAAAAVAAETGFPVALKAQSAALSHKSDAGGVVLGLKDAADLAAGWTKLHDGVARSRPGLALDGVLVEAMAAPGLELILGARNDKGVRCWLSASAEYGRRRSAMSVCCRRISRRVRSPASSASCAAQSCCRASAARHRWM